MTARLYKFPQRRRAKSPASLLQTLAEEAGWLAMAADKLRRGYRLDSFERSRLQTTITRLDALREVAHG